MIKLYSFGSSFGMVDPSPFVLKVDTYMRMANIEFELSPNVSLIGKAPKKRLPFIADGDTTIADSHLIIDYLQEKFNVDLDSNLTKEQKGTSYLIGKSLDDSLYWCLVYSRWADEKTWLNVKNAFFGSMPFPLKYIIPTIARKGVISAMKKQGVAMHSAAEVKNFAKESFDALSDMLGQKKYFFGENPCTFDATAYAFLSQFIEVSLNNDFNDLARGYSNLVAYCTMMKTQYY